MAAQVPDAQVPAPPAPVDMPAPDLSAPSPVVPPPAPEPDAGAAPAPPAEPQFTGVTNAVPLLPANAMGGAARAAALFERIYTIASDNASADVATMAAALARIQAIAEAAIGDVGRFAPEAMRTAAAGEADQMVRGL